ncbi:MAG: GIY-YIG nuclease family protein [Ruminococcaceae bacterium]|nr:GIY-YIG nuclease family protein [Oscillospiraceae bacterium]
MKQGVIYILTNPSFKDWVKIGYADDVEERVRKLNGSECTPFAFRIYATYEVSSRLVDKKMHLIIDKLNRNLRSIDEYNGHRREREFFAITPEDAYAIFEAMADIHDCRHKLKKWAITPESQREEELAEDISDESTYRKKERCANYTFDYWKIPVGAELVYCENESIRCKVVDSRKLEYNGEIMYMTPFAQLISGKKWLMNGPGWVARHFKYNGELLAIREDQTEEQ